MKQISVYNDGYKSRSLQLVAASALIKHFLKNGNMYYGDDKDISKSLLSPTHQNSFPSISETLDELRAFFKVAAEENAVDIDTIQRLVLKTAHSSSPSVLLVIPANDKVPLLCFSGCKSAPQSYISDLGAAFVNSTTNLALDGMSTLEKLKNEKIDTCILLQVKGKVQKKLVTRKKRAPSKRRTVSTSATKKSKTTSE